MSISQTNKQDSERKRERKKETRKRVQFREQNKTSEFIRLEFTSEISLRIEKERKQNGRGVGY